MHRRFLLAFPIPVFVMLTYLFVVFFVGGDETLSGALSSAFFSLPLLPCEAFQHRQRPSIRRMRHVDDSFRRFTLHSSSSSSKDNKVNLVARQKLDTENIQILSHDPLIYTIPNLLSAAECDALQAHVLNLPPSRPLTRSNPPQVSLAVTKLWPLIIFSLLAAVPPVYHAYEASNRILSTTQILATGLPNILLAASLSLALAFGVVLPLLRRQAAATARTSDAVALNQVADDWPVIAPLVDRVVRQTVHAHWEAPVVTRYEPGAVFAQHGDASPTRGSEWQGWGGQRVVTCICYLQTLEETDGGATYFDQLNIKVRPVQGTTLIFFPADSITRQADDRTTHESLPPVQEKWIVQMFGRAEPVPPPLGLPDAVYEGLLETTAPTRK